VEFGMMHLSGHDRSQILLLSEVVDDYVIPAKPGCPSRRGPSHRAPSLKYAF
jgi:hypothetical protein